MALATRPLGTSGLEIASAIRRTRAGSGPARPGEPAVFPKRAG
jgi:hypothetical protein